MTKNIASLHQRRSKPSSADTNPPSSRKQSSEARRRQLANSGPPILPHSDTIHMLSLVTTSQISSSSGTSVTTQFPIQATMSATGTLRPSEGARQPDNTTTNVKAVVFGVVGGTVGMAILLLVLYRLLRRYRDSQHTMIVSAEEKGALGSYSPIHDQFVNQGLPTSPTTDRWSWWRPLTHSRMLSGILSTVGKQEGRGTTKGKTRKRRPLTLYKVRNHKPGHSFEIDSEAASSTVDLSTNTH